MQPIPRYTTESVDHLPVASGNLVVNTGYGVAERINIGGGGFTETGDPVLDQLAILRAEQLSSILGGIETATFADLVALAQSAKSNLATNLTQMGILGIADEPILNLIARILQIPNGFTGKGQLLYLDRLDAWAPFKPFFGVQNKPGGNEGYYPSGGMETGYIVNAEFNPNVGVKFQKSWTRNSDVNGWLSPAGTRVNTIWFRPYVWPENMAIIRYGNGDGWSGSGIKVKNGRLVIQAEVLYDEEYNPDYDYWSGNGDYYLYTDHSTYVDLGPWDSTAFPPTTWHMLAVRSKSLEYNDQYSNPQTRTVYDYYFDGVKVIIPWNTTGIQSSNSWGWGGGWKYPNAGGPEYIHLGSGVWSYGEDTWRTSPDRNEFNYQGWFLDWRGYSSLTDQEIAALYNEGPYQI